MYQLCFIDNEVSYYFIYYLPCWLILVKYVHHIFIDYCKIRYFNIVSIDEILETGKKRYYEIIMTNYFHVEIVSHF